jgi:hypothetical protein
MGPGQPGSAQPGNAALPVTAALLALLTAVATVVFRLILSHVGFNLHPPYIFIMPGYLIAIVLLAVGGILLLLKKRAGRAVAIVGAIVDIGMTAGFPSYWLRLAFFAVPAIATIVVCALPATGRALPMSPAAAPFPPMAPMGAPGQFAPPGQPLPPQQVMPQQFMPQPGFPPQQQPFPPQQPPPGYPQQQFPPPPPGQQPPGYPQQPPGP